MASIAKQVKEASQPQGGYLPLSAFMEKHHKGSCTSCFQENVNDCTVQLAIEYLTRIQPSQDTEKNLNILEAALFGATYLGKSDLAKKLYSGITSESPERAALCAVKLAEFEIYYRTGTLPESNEPDTETLESILTMAKKCRDFFGSSVIYCGFDFEGGYSERITSGNGGYMTEDTLWIITHSRLEPSSCETLLVLVHYIMGLHSYKSRHFRKLKALGIYNPRLDMEYTLNISGIPEKAIEDVSKNIIGYN